jgi:dihydroorotase
LTVRAGKVVYDLNGISSDIWNKPPTSDYKLARHWTTMTTRDESKKLHSAEAH